MGATRDIGGGPPGVVGGPAPGRDTRGTPVAPVRISVVHGSLANATYALMVGAFAEEQFSGIERFIDRQFDGLLSSWREVDRYPSSLGHSRFIEPTRDAAVETEPPGCYVIGLGPFASFGRAELARAVRAALLDRCLDLCRAPSGADVDAIEVGVSSTLMGVQADDGLGVDESVAAIVDGVVRANEDLARYVGSRRDAVCAVRIVALELIERYADSVNLAAAAVRSLANAVELGEGYDDLTSVIVERRDGGLPIGASMYEQGRRWKRIVITESGHNADDAAADEAGLRLDVSLLGRDARADRVHHRLDSAMVDALVERLATDSSDVRTAATLYEQLIPEALRGRFQTASQIQFIVDRTTANYPWELLTAPRSIVGGEAATAGRPAALSERGAVMRQFTESEERRLDPARASSGSALVIGAGRVPGETELPGVFAEIASVVSILSSALGQHRVTVLDDRNAELDLVELQNELFGDHQVLHVASHGVHVDDDPQRTGAVLSRSARLSVNLVRQLPRVPDIVFLNCCSVGRIGMNRLAAGLAREFMAIGVRALVVAAWPISDEAASEFAKVFYDELTEGRPLGDCVARARLACARRAGSGETWAAYQCYGDPGFVMRGHAETHRTARRAPVSDTDLSSRLETLAVMSSDLGRPGRGGVDERRRRLRETWSELDAFVTAHPELVNDGVKRALATTARDLGDFRMAAEQFRELVSWSAGPERAIRPRSRTTCVADVQQAANCRARAAQASARDAIAAGDEVRLATNLGELAEAVELAEAAIALLPERESYGVLGSALKRRATIDAERRPELIAASVAAYRIGAGGAPVSGTDDDVWVGENAMQLTLLLGGEDAARIRELVAARAARVPSGGDAPGTAPRLVDERRTELTDYWLRADSGDRALTELLMADEGELASATSVMVRTYQRAFASRSTWSQRASTMEHLHDLCDLLPEQDARRPHLAAAREQLAEWEVRHVAGH